MLLSLKAQLSLPDFTLSVDLCLRAHSTALFGPSGAGKTSLLDLIAGLRRAESAFVQIDDAVLTDSRRNWCVPPRLRRVGYVPQDSALFPHLSVRQNLLYGWKNGSLRLDEVIETLELRTLLERNVTRLSGGERQRVALARALLSSPRLLLLDEPLASLDRDLKARLLPFLQAVRERFDVPLLYVTHDPDELLPLCEEVVVLRQGRCVRQAPAAEIFRGADSAVLPRPPDNLPGRAE